MSETSPSKYFPPIYIKSREKKVAIEPREGRNYTKQNIKQFVAPSISEKLRKAFWNSTKASKLNLLFVFPNSGTGNIAPFLLETDPSVPDITSRAVMYEQDKYIKNTIEDYGFDKSRYSFEGDFIGTPENLKRKGETKPIVFLDAINLPIKDSQDGVDVRFNGYSVYAWIKRSSHCQFFCVMVKNSVKLKDVAGFVKNDSIKVGKYTVYLYYAKPNITDKQKLPALLKEEQIRYIGGKAKSKASPKKTSKKEISKEITKEEPKKTSSLAAIDLMKIASTPAGSGKEVSLIEPAKVVEKETTVKTSVVKELDCPNLDEYFFKIYDDSVEKDDDVIELHSGKNKTVITRQQWKNMITERVRAILSDAVPDDNKPYIEKIVGPGTIDIFMRALTSKDIEPNPLKNYESFEKLGDRIMGEKFASYLLDRFPAINESQMNDLARVYVSNTEQASISSKLGLPKLANRLGVVVEDPHFREDLLEAFFAAIQLACEKSFNYSVGSIICYNMVKYIYTPYQLTLADAVRPQKNPVKEILEKVGLNAYFEKIESEDNQGNKIWTRSIYVLIKSRDKKDIIASNYKLKNRLIREGAEYWNKRLSPEWGIKKLGKGASLLATSSGLHYMMGQAAEDKLSIEAYNKLEEMGLSYIKASRIHDYIYLDREYLAPYKERLLEKIQKQGFDRPLFKLIQKKDVGKDATVALIGVYLDGSDKRIVATAGQDAQDAEIRAICLYLNRMA